MYMIQSPLAIWEDNNHFKVGPVCDPQNKASVLAMFPKTNPDSKMHAMLFKRVLYKWRTENKRLDNPGDRGIVEVDNRKK